MTRPQAQPQVLAGWPAAFPYAPKEKSGRGDRICRGATRRCGWAYRTVCLFV